MTLMVEMPNHDLLVTHKSSAGMVEYTTNCNMRCSYCAVSKEGWRIIDLDDGLAERITDEIIQRCPEGIMIHGHGETTMLPDWENKANRFLDAGVRVSICTNLAKSYSKHELLTLARLDHLTISIDTVDVDLFRKLRRGGDIRHVIYNMTRIRELADRIKKERSVSWSIVCCDKTIWGLEDLVRYGISLGVDGFSFCNLETSDVPKGGLETKHVSQMSPDDCRKALEIFAKIDSLCKEHNRISDIKAGIIDTLVMKSEEGVTHSTRLGV